MKLLELRELLTKYVDTKSKIEKYAQEYKEISAKLFEIKEIDLEDISEELAEMIIKKSKLDDEISSLKIELEEIKKDILSLIKELGLPKHVIYKTGDIRFMVLDNCEIKVSRGGN